MATLRQYSERTSKEIRLLLERARQDPSFRTGLNQALPAEYNRDVRWFRTDVNTITTEYPAFADAVGHQLPVKVLKHTYDSGEADPVILATDDDDTRSWYIYSPYGWIPQFIDIHATLHHGLWIPTYVPELEVTITEAGGIAAAASGEVTIVKHGTANGQTFDAWFDHMDAGTATEDAEARVALMPGEKKWRIINLGCE